jgi:diketogulonate reductase-like aldo/keto reductase
VKSGLSAAVIDIFDFELSEDEMQQIYDLDRQERYERW